MTAFKSYAQKFFDGYFYPVFIALIIFIGHTFSIEAFSTSIVVISAIMCVLICDDLRALISPFFMILFNFSYKTYKSGWLGKGSFAIFVGILLTLFFGSVIAHFIIYKKGKLLKSIPKSALFWGIIALSIAFLLNGFFNFKEYTAINIIFALLLIFFLAITYFIFFCGIINRDDTTEYLFYVLYVASILLILQMAVLLLRDASFFPDGSIDKNTLILGWGMWNNVGGMLAMLLPVHFYYAAVKKHGYIFYATAMLTYITIVFTLSRSSLLFATLISIICVAIICFKGQNIRINRIISCCLAVVAVLGIIVLWGKISNVLASYLNQGFDDNGRIELYKHGFENFLSHPIFGGGFDSCMEDNFGHGIEPNRYHNTFIELIATCGVLGIGAYIFHRYQTIRLILKRREHLSTLFLTLSIATLLLTSLLDNHFFNLYPTMYYSVILCVLEKNDSIVSK